MAKYTHKREYYIPKGAVKIQAKDSTALCYVKYGTGNGQAVDVVAFQGKRQKPTGNYRFTKGEAVAQKWMKEFFQDVASSERMKANYKERTKQRAAEMRDKIKVGDIFFTSWGYDQTNVDFYQVIKKAGAMLWYVAIGKEIMPDGQAADLVMPDTNLVGTEEYKAMINEYGFKVSSFEFAYPWDGAPKHQTAWGYGH